jgi:Ser/Thr protein kinase RdoA (MazF antagonist)
LPRRIDDLAQYRRPSLSDPELAELARACGVDDPASAVDLGGTMSLNVLVPRPEGKAVLRIHPPFATRGRVRALQQIRTDLAAAGLNVGVPEPLDGRDVVMVGQHVAELERFVEQQKPPPEWPSYVWMYGAMGRLHRALASSRVSAPRPVVATYGTPSSLRRWLDATRRAVTGDAEAEGIVEWTERLLRQLVACWVPARQLPEQVVHGDLRLGNVCVADAESGEPVYFDFGFAARRPRVHELAYSLPWIVLRPDASGRPQDFDWSRVDELVAAYEGAAGWTLDPLERRALGPLVAAVPLYLASVAAFTPDPRATVKGETPLLRIAEWVLQERPLERSGR